MLVTQVARRLVDTPPDESALIVALGDVGAFLNADLVALVQLAPDETALLRRYEWRRADMEPWPTFPDELPLVLMPWIGANLHEVETPFVVPNISYLPGDADAPRRGMVVLGLRSVGLIPLRRAGRSVGLVFACWRREADASDAARMQPLAPLGDVLLAGLARVDGEIALHTRESHYRAIVRESPDVIVISTPTGHFEVLSKALERMTGFAVPDFDAARLVLHPDDLAAVQLRYGEALATPREPVPVCTRVRTVDGEWRYLEGTFTNLLDDPAVGGVVLNAHDVTARVELELQVTQSQRIDGLGRLAGAVAHDFRNVSFAIRSFAQFALARAERGDDVSAELREILRGCEHADGLVSQLLSFGRPEPESSAAVDPAAALDELGPTLNRLVPAGVRLDVTCVSHPPLALVSQTQLEQIVLNLVTNAIDAMPDGGTLTLAFETDPGTIRIVVTDTGIGMDDEVRARIFEPFFTTKRDGAGNGLGLSIVHAIATAANGTVAAETAPGRGTRMIVTLPALEA